MKTEIKSLDCVNEFIVQLAAERLNYHPDDDFANYVNMETGKFSYASAEAYFRNL